MSSGLKKKKLLRMFKPEALDAFKKNRFSGRLFVRWKNGKITRFKMRAEVGFSNSGPDEEDFTEYIPF